MSRLGFFGDSEDWEEQKRLGIGATLKSKNLRGKRRMEAGEIV